MQFDHRDSRPIYAQLAQKMRDQMLAGVLRPGDKLPSVRVLAGELAINPNTISRAYRELETEGWVVSVPGKGVFVREDTAAGAAHQKQLLEKVEALVRELEVAGMSRETIIEHLKGETRHA